MSQPIPLDEGMTLTPVGELEVQGSRLIRDFQLRFHGVVMNARGFVEVGDHGLSVIGLALFDAGEAELMDRALQSVAESIALTEPARPTPQAQPEPTERPAASQTGTGGGDLAGRAVVRYHNSEITSSRWRYFFCSDGTFAYRYNSSTVSTGGMGSLSMADQDSAQGRWTLSGNTVTLTPDQGAELTLEISDRSGSSLTVSGQTWHFTENTFCP